MRLGPPPHNRLRSPSLHAGMDPVTGGRRPGRTEALGESNIGESLPLPAPLSDRYGDKRQSDELGLICPGFSQGDCLGVTTSGQGDLRAGRLMVCPPPRALAIANKDRSHGSNYLFSLSVLPAPPIVNARFWVPLRPQASARKSVLYGR